MVAEVAVVETLALLGERASESMVWITPLARDNDWRGALTLEPDAAVWVVRPAGSLTGRVGDLGLGLTNPLLEGDGWSGGGLLMDADPGSLAELIAGLEISVFSGCRALRSGVFAGRLDVDVVAGLLGALLTVGDLAGLAVDLLAGGAARGFGGALVVVLVAAGFATSLPLAFSFSLPLVVPFTSSASAVEVEPLPEATGLSAAPSAPGLLNRREAPAGASLLESCAVLTGGSVAWFAKSVRGDSGIG